MLDITSLEILEILLRDKPRVKFEDRVNINVSFQTCRKNRVSK